jgi:TetR/AcrR family transcriptional regulator, cholesterol catabolism regulator
MSKTYSEILEQVSRLYHRYGIKSVTMDDVAKHLCISKKTLYEHFSDKEKLVWEVMKMEGERWFARMEEIGNRDLNAIEQLFEVYKILKLIFRDYNPSVEFDLRKYYTDLALKLREIRRKMIFESVYRNLNKGKKEGLYRKDLNSTIIAKLHLLRVENMVMADLFTIAELTSFKLFHETFIYHLNGIMSPAGRVFFEENFRKFREQLDPHSA